MKIHSLPSTTRSASSELEKDFNAPKFSKPEKNISQSKNPSSKIDEKFEGKADGMKPFLRKVLGRPEQQIRNLAGDTYHSLTTNHQLFNGGKFDFESPIAMGGSPQQFSVTQGRNGALNFNVQGREYFSINGASIGGGEWNPTHSSIPAVLNRAMVAVQNRLEQIPQLSPRPDHVYERPVFGNPLNPLLSTDPDFNERLFGLTQPKPSASAQELPATQLQASSIGMPAYENLTPSPQMPIYENLPVPQQHPVYQNSSMFSGGVALHLPEQPGMQHLPMTPLSIIPEEPNSQDPSIYNQLLHSPGNNIQQGASSAAVSLQPQASSMGYSQNPPPGAVGPLPQNVYDVLLTPASASYPNAPQIPALPADEPPVANAQLPLGIRESLDPQGDLRSSYF